MLVPAPRTVTPHAGDFVLTADTSLYAPPQVADLVRELLGPATGLVFRRADGPGPGVLSFDVVDNPTTGDEGYRLTVSADGVSTVAQTIAGLRWAVQTLRQLLPVQAFAAAPATGVTWRIAAQEITDRPAFGWRGCLLDVARWCHPLPFVRRFVDLLAAHKLNVLHLHLTDDQGWRFEVKRYPRLTEIGGFRAQSSAGHARENRLDGVPHGGFYTQDELRDLVAYATRRGVHIMPEVDVPGHTQAAIAAYPELGNASGRTLEVRPTWGISPHVLNVSDATVDVVRDILDELVEVFPFELVHIGGDECPTREWQASPDAVRRVGELGLSGVGRLQGWFAGELAAHLARHGRRVGVWDELIELGAPADATVFGWRGPDRVQAALDAGFDVVAAPQTHTYLDYAESITADEPLAIGGPLPLSKVYGYRPPSPGPGGAAGRVLGPEAAMWSEYVPTTDLVEWRAFPRLAAVAEVGWTGAGGDFADFRSRLLTHVGRLGQAKVRYRPLD